MAAKKKTAVVKPAPQASIEYMVDHVTKSGKVCDYVLIDNLWVDPAKARALLARLAKEPAVLHSELADAIAECEAASEARKALAVAVKQSAAVQTAAPAMADAEYEEYQAFLRFRRMQSAAVQTAAPAKRESAKERTERLRSVTK